MSLTEELIKRREISRKRIPVDQLAAMDRATDDLARSDIVDTCFKEGDTAPNFVLSTGTGEQVSLAELLKSGPVVVSFFRGGW